VVGVTGSTGKTSTKDVLAAMCATAGPPWPPQNLNTEIGLPSPCSSARGTEVLVLEMAMRGAGRSPSSPGSPS
jgi:UDP-N-acetylmuramoyl-tripeptide--D-alanyl-D-alanine ligase